MCVSRMGSLKPTLFSDTPTCHTWINKDPSVGKYTIHYYIAIHGCYDANVSSTAHVSKPFSLLRLEMFFSYLLSEIQQSTVCAGVLAMKSILDLLDLESSDVFMPNITRLVSQNKKRD